MSDGQTSKIPPPSAEHRKIAAQQFERASKAISSRNFDYGIKLLQTCCKIDPANLIYRKTLRLAEKTKYKKNMRGSAMAFLTASPSKAKLKAAQTTKDYLKVLEYGEEALAYNPWDTGVQADMAAAADALGELDLAIWIMEESRQKNPKNSSVNRRLARLYEKRGDFTQAINLWDLIRQVNPRDDEAAKKTQELAATDTITRGKYEATQAEAEEAGLTRPGLKPTESEEDEQPADEPAAEAPPTPAVAELQEAIDADPTNTHAYLRLAGVHRRAGELEKARAVLQRGLGPTGNDFEIAIELAELKIDGLRRDLALADKRLRAKSTDPDARAARSRLVKEINTRELELYRQKADRYPTNKAYHYELGLRLFRAGQVDEAIGELQGLRGDAKFGWRALMYLGLCFKARDNWRLAQRNLEEALSKVPETEKQSRKEILFQLAQGNAEAEDFEKAGAFAQELIALDPKFRDVSRLAAEWKSRGGSKPAE